MKNFTLSLKCIISLSLLLFVSTTFAQSLARYNITFSSNWENETVDPLDGNSTAAIPGNAHWSDLVGATHNSNYTLVEIGTLASIGVKNVAETGNNNALFNEVQNEINTTSNANQWLQEGFTPFAAISTAMITTDVSSDYPLLSLVSMIAPSPDWMIAVNSINLRDGNTWKSSITIDLFPYDAGTDSGMTYTAGNQPTLPNPEVISVLINEGPFNAQPIGTLTITLDQVLSVNEQEITEVNLYPNPSNGLISLNTSPSNTLQDAQVYDVLGKQVAGIENRESRNDVNFDLRHLNEGIYVIRLRLVDGSQFTKKVVIR